MKKTRLLLLLALIGIVGFILYFTYPLKVDRVLPHLHAVEKIEVMAFTNGETASYTLSKELGDDFENFVTIWDSVRYNRERNQFIDSGEASLIMTVYYKSDEGLSNTYSIELYDSGTLIRRIGGFQNKSWEYKLYGNAERVFRQLHDWIKSEATPLG